MSLLVEHIETTGKGDLTTPCYDQRCIQVLCYRLLSNLVLISRRKDIYHSNREGWNKTLCCPPSHSLEFGWRIALLRSSIITSISSNSFCPTTISRNISITAVIGIMALFATLSAENSMRDSMEKKKHTLKQVTSLGSLRWGIWSWLEEPVARPGALSRSAYLAKPGGGGPRSRVEGGGGGS